MKKIIRYWAVQLTKEDFVFLLLNRGTMKIKERRKLMTKTTYITGNTVGMSAGSMTDATTHSIPDPCIVSHPSYINNIAIKDTDYKINLSPSVEADLFQKFLNKMQEVSFTPTVEHKCHNCGGVLELKITEHIFRCPFCNSVYAFGTQLVNG